MGQYYKAIVLDEAGQVEHWLHGHDFDSGWKLMEHSWLGNKFVAAVESLLAQEAPRRVVWAGDYADAETGPDGQPLTYTSTRDGKVYVHDLTLHVMCTEDTHYMPDLPDFGMQYFHTGKRDKNGDGIFGKRRDPDLVPNVDNAIRVTSSSHPYILNWDKREYVSKRSVPRTVETYSGKKSWWAVHPLPLLTAEGNGRGGGDFGDENETPLVGRWARDHISVNKTAPQKGWTRIKFDLTH